jgi:hypothetical protein
MRQKWRTSSYHLRQTIPTPSSRPSFCAAFHLGTKASASSRRTKRWETGNRPNSCATGRAGRIPTEHMVQQTAAPHPEQTGRPSRGQPGRRVTTGRPDRGSRSIAAIAQARDSATLLQNIEDQFRQVAALTNGRTRHRPHSRDRSKANDVTSPAHGPADRGCYQYYRRL